MTIDPNHLAAYSSHLLSSAVNDELEQRLGLYRVFLKLYENHRSLLDEILNLENLSQRPIPGMAPSYVQGLIIGRQAHLLTNLLDGKTQVVQEPNNVWAIGRSRKVHLPIADERLSRRHSEIHYVAGKGFYLVDLKSTNGSFVNGDPIKGEILLKDGDRIRLSSVAFTFFTGEVSASLSKPILEQLHEFTAIDATPTPLPQLASDSDCLNEDETGYVSPATSWETSQSNRQEENSYSETLHFVRPQLS